MTQRLAPERLTRIRDRADSDSDDGSQSVTMQDRRLLLAEIDALRAELAGAEGRGREAAYRLVERELRSIRGVVDYTVNTPGIRHYPDDSESSRCVWAPTMIEAVDKALASSKLVRAPLLGTGTAAADGGESQP